MTALKDILTALRQSIAAHDLSPQLSVIYASELKTFVQRLQEKDYDMAISALLFQEENITSTIKISLEDKGNSASVQIMLEVILILMDLVGTRIQPFAVVIKSACIASLISKLGGKVKIAALETLSGLIKLSPEDIDFKAIFTRLSDIYVHRNSQNSASLKGAILKTLGYISRYNAANLCQSQLEDFYRYIISCLKTQSLNSTSNLSLVSGALHGLNNLLYTNISICDDIELLFGIIHKVIRPTDELVRYELPKGFSKLILEGLYLFSNHTHLFSTHLLSRYDSIYQQLTVLANHKNKELYRAGRKALFAYLTQISITLYSKEHENILLYLLAGFLNIMNDSNRELSEYSVSALSLGMLARPIYQILGSQKLYSVIQIVCRNFDQIRSSNIKNEEIYSRAASYLDSFTSLFYYHDRLDAFLIDTSAAAIDYIIDNFPAMYNLRRKEAIESIVNFLWLMNNRNSLRSIWSLVVQKLILLAFSELQITYSDGQDNELDQTEKAFKEYLHFWKLLLDEKTLTLVHAKDKDNSAFFSTLFEQIILALIDLPDILNLKIELIQDEDEVEATATQSYHDLRRLKFSLPEVSSY